MEYAELAIIHNQLQSAVLNVTWYDNALHLRKMMFHLGSKNGVEPTECPMMTPEYRQQLLQGTHRTEATKGSFESEIVIATLSKEPFAKFQALANKTARSKLRTCPARVSTVSNFSEMCTCIANTD